MVAKIGSMRYDPPGYGELNARMRLIADGCLLGLVLVAGDVLVLRAPSSRPSTLD